MAGEDRARGGRAQVARRSAARGRLSRARRAARPDSGSAAPARAPPRRRRARASRRRRRSCRRCPPRRSPTRRRRAPRARGASGTTRGCELVPEAQALEPAAGVDAGRHRLRVGYRDRLEGGEVARARDRRAARRRARSRRACSRGGPARSAARTRPSRSSASICAVSAEKKTSAGAPARICRARSLEAPKLKTARQPEAFSHARPTSVERIGQARRGEDADLLAAPRGPPRARPAPRTAERERSDRGAGQQPPSRKSSSSHAKPLVRMLTSGPRMTPAQRPAVPLRAPAGRGRPLPRPVRPLRHLRPPRGRAPHLHGALRPAAPRPGVGGHRGERRRAAAPREGHGPRQRRVHGRAARAAARATARSATCATRPPGDTVAANAQPYLIECHRGPIAVGHNGNLVNAAILRHELEAAGSIFQSTSDTEVILHLYARSHRERLEDAIAASLYKVMGAFSLLFLTPDALVAARDPWGFRPLVLGRLERRHRGRLRDLRPRPDRRRVRARRRAGRGAWSSTRDGRALVQALPARAGRALRLRARLLRAARQPGLRPQRARVAPARSAASSRARRPPTPTSWCPVPDSGMGAALGFSQESGLPFEWGLIRNHYVGPHLHRAAAGPSASFGRQDQAQPGAPGDRGQARGADRRLDRARHHLAQDRAHGARGRARARCTCASRARPPPAPATTASTRRCKSELIARLALGRGDPRASSRPTAWPTSRTRAC